MLYGNLLYMKWGVHMKKYTQLLKELREDRDLRQSEIAQILGTSQQHYSRYETGEIEMPLRVMDALADYYGVSTDFLMGRTDSREGISSLNAEITPGHTVGGLVSKILSLDSAGRQSVVEYVELQTIKEQMKKHPDKK